MVGLMRLVALAALLGFAACAAQTQSIDSQPGGANVAQVQSPTNPRFEGYVSANLKMQIAPVPTPVDRAEAARFAASRLGQPLSLHGLEQLARFAAFHGLSEAATGFQALLRGDEREPEAIKRAALALMALAEIGDDAQRRAAQQFFRGLLDRAPATLHTASMERVADAFGKPEEAASLKAWCEREVKIQKSLLAEYAKAGASEELSALATSRLRALEEFLSVRIPRLEAANKVRERILAAPLEARIVPLCDHYVDLLNISTEELSWWSALRLMRLTESNPATKSRTAEQFLRLAERYQKSVDAGFEQAYAYCRGRCLRAAVFFGHELNAETRAWLDKLGDVGVDVLALRPNWKY